MRLSTRPPKDRKFFGSTIQGGILPVRPAAQTDRRKHGPDVGGRSLGALQL